MINEKGKDFPGDLLKPEQLAELINLVEEGKVSYTIASHKLLVAVIEEPGKTALQLAQQLNLLQERNEDTLSLLIDEVLNAMPAKVEEYRKGKKGLMGLFVGEVMKKSKGKADPRLLNQLLSEKLVN